MRNLFIDIIRVSIGNQICLSHTPSASEWGELYAMAKKQSLVGVCFAGVQRLASQYQAPPEKLYLKWMGMAAKIQQRNEAIGKQCADLPKRLSDAGLRSSILKGQGVDQLYPSVLRNLRQPGDIDVWVDGDRDEVFKRLAAMGVKVDKIDSVHAHADVFTDTEVEVHSRPSWMYGSKGDKAFTEFWTGCKDEQFAHFDETVGFCYPTVAFNLVYSLLHINRHIFEEGIGLRQLMD